MGMVIAEEGEVVSWSLSGGQKKPGVPVPHPHPTAAHQPWLWCCSSGLSFGKFTSLFALPHHL